MKSSGKRSRFAFDRLVQPSYAYAVQHRQVGIQHYLVAPDQKNRPLNTLAMEYVRHCNYGSLNKDEGSKVEAERKQRAVRVAGSENHRDCARDQLRPAYDNSPL
jgi:hypothetical protein